ncbi:hypothetical protein BC936DRAFT_139739, partial [Jimgerdemannia flammicorona]
TPTPYFYSHGTFSRTTPPPTAPSPTPHLLPHHTTLLPHHTSRMTYPNPTLTLQQFPIPTLPFLNPTERSVKRVKLSRRHEPSDKAQTAIYSSSDLSVNLPTYLNGSGDITNLKGDVHAMFPGLNKIASNLSPAKYSEAISKYEIFNKGMKREAPFDEASQRDLVPAGQNQAYQQTYKSIRPAPIPIGSQQLHPSANVPKLKCDKCRKKHKCSVHATKFIGERNSPGRACSSCRERKRKCQGSPGSPCIPSNKIKTGGPPNAQMHSDSPRVIETYQGLPSPPLSPPSSISSPNESCEEYDHDMVSFEFDDLDLFASYDATDLCIVQQIDISAEYLPTSETTPFCNTNTEGLSSPNENYEEYDHDMVSPKFDDSNLFASNDVTDLCTVQQLDISAEHLETSKTTPFCNTNAKGLSSSNESCEEYNRDMVSPEFDVSNLFPSNNAIDLCTVQQFEYFPTSETTPFCDNYINDDSVQAVFLTTPESANQSTSFDFKALQTELNQPDPRESDPVPSSDLASQALMDFDEFTFYVLV